MSFFSDLLPPITPLENVKQRKIQEDPRFLRFLEEENILKKKRMQKISQNRLDQLNQQRRQKFQSQWQDVKNIRAERYNNPEMQAKIKEQDDKKRQEEEYKEWMEKSRAFKKQFIAFDLPCGHHVEIDSLTCPECGKTFDLNKVSSLELFFRRYFF